VSADTKRSDVARLTCPQCGTTFDAEGEEFCPNSTCGYPTGFMAPVDEEEAPAIEMQRRPGEKLEALVPKAAEAPASRIGVPPTAATTMGGTSPAGGTVGPLAAPNIAASSDSSSKPVSLSNGTTITYEASNTLDDDLSTAWNDGDPVDPGIGAHLTYQFVNPVHLVGTNLVNGYTRSLSKEDVLHLNARLKQVTISYDGGSAVITLADTVTPHRVDLDLGTTSRVVLQVDSVDRGSTYLDVALTDLLET
jgi:hypothetical protein